MRSCLLRMLTPNPRETTRYNLRFLPPLWISDDEVKQVPKKIPMRQCVGCREMKPKKELIRVVRSPEGVVSLDFKGKLPGRGAYVCPDPACLAKARKSKGLERAFSAPLPNEVWEALEAQMKEVPPDAQ